MFVEYFSTYFGVEMIKSFGIRAVDSFSRQLQTGCIALGYLCPSNVLYFAPNRLRLLYILATTSWRGSPRASLGENLVKGELLQETLVDKSEGSLL